MADAKPTGGTFTPLEFSPKFYSPKNPGVALQKILNSFGDEKGTGGKILDFIANKLGKSGPEGDKFVKLLEVSTAGIKNLLTLPIYGVAFLTLIKSLGIEGIKALLTRRKENATKKEAEIEAMAKKVIEEAENIRKYQEFLSNTEATEVLLPQQQELIGKFFKNSGQPYLDTLNNENIYGWLYLNPADGNDVKKFEDSIKTRKERTVQIDNLIKRVPDQTNKEAVTNLLLATHTYLANPDAANPAGLSDADKEAVKTIFGISNFDTDRPRLLIILEDIKKIFGLVNKAGEPYAWTETLQMVKNVEATADKLLVKPEALDAYNEIWITGAAHTVIPLNASVGAGKAMPEDIKEDFRKVGFGNGGNPFLALGFLTPPSAGDITAKQTELRTTFSTLPDEATLQVTLNNFAKKKYSNDEIGQNINVLSLIGKKQVEVLNTVSEIYQQININPGTTALTFNFTGKSINLSGSEVEEIKKIFFKFDTSGSILLNQPVEFSDAALTSLMRMPGISPDAKEFYDDILDLSTDSLFNNLLFSTPKGALNFVNDLTPYFELIYDAVDGDLSLLNSKEWDLQDGGIAPNIVRALESRIELKLQICNQLAVLAATPDEYNKVKQAHKKHLLRLIDGEISVLDNLSSPNRDPEGYIVSIKDAIEPYINIPEYKTIISDSGLGDIDLDILEAPEIDNAIVVKKLSDYPDVIKIKEVLEKIGEIVLARFSNIVSQFRDDFENAPADIQKEVLDLNNLIQTLMTIGLDTSTVELNEKMFKMYLNGLLNYPVSLSNQKLIDSVGNGRFRFHMDYIPTTTQLI